MSIRRMLSWFPSAWRDRYEAEVRELIEAHPFGWRERRDLLGACADAWGREVWRWAYATVRMAGAIGVRLAAVLAVGWMWLQLVDVLADLETTRAVATAGGLWVSAIAGFRVPMALLLQLFIARPYADSGAAVDRPSWTQTIAATLLLVVLAAVDGRGGPVRELPDMLFLGMAASMRHARWFNVFETHRPLSRLRPRLGLQ